MASASKTPNLNLPQWVASEKPEMVDFNEAFGAIDAAQNPQPIVLTPATGITLVIYKAYKTNNLISFSLRAELTSGDPFAVGNVAICTVPSTPAPSDSLTPLNGMGYTAGGVTTEVKYSRLEKYNRTISCANQAATTKSIYISGFYFV